MAGPWCKLTGQRGGRAASLASRFVDQLAEGHTVR